MARRVCSILSIFQTSQQAYNKTTNPSNMENLETIKEHLREIENRNLMSVVQAELRFDRWIFCERALLHQPPSMF